METTPEIKTAAQIVIHEFAEEPAQQSTHEQNRDEDSRERQGHRDDGEAYLLDPE